MTETSIKFGTGRFRQLLKHNYAATTGPSTTDDNTAGYGPGSDWVDTTNDKTWRCVDGTTNAAIWKQLDRVPTQMLFVIPGVLVVGTDRSITGRIWGNKSSGTVFVLEEVYAEVKTAPTGASLIFDVNKNGTTVFGTQSNRPTIAASGTTATSGAPSVTTFAKNDAVTIDTDQIGSSVAGADAMIWLRGYYLSTN